MRPLVCLLLLSSLAAAAAPPAPPAEVRALIGRLADADWAARRAALVRLQALDDEMIPTLHAAAREQVDPDVRLRLFVAARAIRERGWGPLKAVGPGAALKQRPPCRRALTAGFGDATVKVWELERGRPEESFGGHMGGVLGVAFSADGRRALSSDSVCCVRLWKLGR